MPTFAVMLHLCLIWVASSPARAESLTVDPRRLAPVDVVHEDFDGLPLGFRMQWYRGEEAIDRIGAEGSADFRQGQAAVINHGYTSAAFWYRLVFVNPSDDAQTIYLHDPHNVYDDFKIYQGDKLIRALHEWDPLENRIVPLTLPPHGQAAIHVYKRSEAVVHQATFSFWKDYEALRRSIQTSELRYQTVITSLLMTAFLSLALVFAYRRLIYLYYLGYLLAFSAFATWVWSVYDLSPFTHWGGLLSIFCVTFTALFVDEFLALREVAPRMHRAFRAYAALSLGVLLLEFINPLWRAYAGSILSITIQLNTLILAMFLYYRLRQPHLLIFIVAFGSFLGSGFIQLIIWMGMVDSTNNLLMFYGVAIENALMVLAIGHRITVTEDTRKRKDTMLAHGYEQLSKVFYPHQIKQISEGRKVEETMPIGEGIACVLHVQIVGGSAHLNENYEDWLESFKVACRRLLMERYDGEKFCSDAYIIRELGDGFLCSVGFPFRQVGPLKSEAAVQLAEQLIAEFNRKVPALDAAQQIYCSIGIVRGVVKSYFYRSGRIRDDLWGQAINKASQYAAASASVFSTLQRPPQNVILLHDAVYASLPEKSRQSCEVLDAKTSRHILDRDLDGEWLALRLPS